MLNRPKEENLFMNKVVFSDEATFHLSGKVNLIMEIIWEPQNPHQGVEHVRDSARVEVFCVVSGTWLYEPLSFAEAKLYSRVPLYAGELPCFTAECTVDAT
jgi:hypothetical protein